MTSSTRERTIIRTSHLGIGINILLVIMKTLVGLAAHSVAIVLDAVNNATDVISSLVTIVGTKIASRPADRHHPYGHGRVEYMTAAIIGAIIGYAGITALWEAVQKIIHPDSTQYTWIALMLIAVGVLAKIFLGLYVKKTGHRVHSGTLVASGEDALMDAILSTTTLVAAFLNFFLGWQIEGYLGVIISLMILRTAWEVWHDATDSITGLRADAELIARVRAVIAAFDQVQGVYDLTLHDYGPGKTIGTAHIQVDDQLPARDIHHLTRHIEVKVYEQLGIIMTIGIYASNTSGKSGTIRRTLDKIIARHPTILQVHGFYVDEETQHIFFDVIFDFVENNQSQIITEITDQLHQKFPKYETDVIIDTDISE